ATASAEAGSVADPARRWTRRMRARARRHQAADGTWKSPRYYRTVTGLLSACLQSATQIVELARDLVAVESPSTDRDALERCAAVLVARLVEAGASVERVDAKSTAAHVIADWPGAGPRVLLVGHFDTVWPVGQLARMPLEVKDG